VSVETPLSLQNTSAQKQIKIFAMLSLDKRDVPAIDMSFVISATAIGASENFQQTKDIINRMVLKYGTEMIRYSLIVFGENPVIQHRLVINY